MRTWKQRINSFGYAFKGVGVFLKTQPHAQFHLAFALFVTIAGFFFNIATWEWVAVVLMIALVLMAEAFNTALEFLTDLASPDYHPLAGKAKDVAAGAVLIAAIGAVIVGFIIFFPKLLTFLGIHI